MTFRLPHRRHRSGRRLSRLGIVVLWACAAIAALLMAAPQIAMEFFADL